MSKLTKLREKMKLAGLDAIIVLDELNQKYLSEFAFTDGLLLITLAEAHLITDFRYYEMAIKSASAEFKTAMPEDRKTFINDILKS